MFKGFTSGGTLMRGHTMESHRSKNLPDIDFSRDGHVRVVEQDGTFPLRATPRAVEEDRNFTVHGFDFAKIYNSKPKRYKKRAPLPREYAAEVAVIAGGVTGCSGNTTIASGTSSLGRKVRQKKRRNYDLQRAFNSVRSASSVDFSDMAYSSLGRSFGSSSSVGRSYGSSSSVGHSYGSSVSSESLEKLQFPGEPDFLDPGRRYSGEHIQLPFIPGSKVKPRKRSKEPLPYVLFMMLGVVLLILGITRMLVCWWHQYACALWTGILCIALSVLGLYHRTDYTHRIKNTAFIAVALCNTLAALISSGLVLAVLFPTIRGLVQNARPEDLAHQLTFSSLNGSLLSLPMDYDTVLYISLALDVGTLCVVLVDFLSLRAFIVAANNHWDAAYDVTGDCDHRGHPAHFNPIHQIIVGLATSFVGIVVSIIMTSPVNHGWSLIWAGLVVMVAGLVSTAHCKRCDLKILGICSLGIQVAALLCVCLSTVMITVSFVDDINVIYTEGEYLVSGRRWDLSASLFFQSLYLLTTVIDILYILAVFFRSCRHMCIYGHDKIGGETES